MNIEHASLISFGQVRVVFYSAPKVGGVYEIELTLFYN